MFRAELERHADAYRLDADVVHAMVLQESGGNPWAWNPEPRYPYFWDVRARGPFRRVGEAELKSKQPPSDFPTLAGDRDQEWWAQQASWGLLQIMGALARERGFRGPYLSQLCDPELNLDLGCAIFADLVRWAGGDVWVAVAGYNGGRGGWSSPAAQQHAQKVRELVSRGGFRDFSATTT